MTIEIAQTCAISGKWAIFHLVFIIVFVILVVSGFSILAHYRHDGVVLNNHDTFTIDNRPIDPPRAFLRELELSSNFRLSDTEFQTRLVEQGYCENDILSRCYSRVFESCQARRVHWLPRQPCVTDRRRVGCWDCR